MNKKLIVTLYGEAVGKLYQDENGKMQFEYLDTARQAISVAMPLQKEPFLHEACEAYFGGLLPESEHARKMLAKQFGISANNTFSLIHAIGYDCAGAVSCLPEEQIDIKLGENQYITRIISDGELYQHIVELPQKPLFINVDGLRLSLAGAQDKAAVCVSDNKVALAEEHCPTTHILKPASKQFDSIAINEYFCMRLAKRMGLPVADVSFHQLQDIQYLLIERYDRKISNSQIARIHQEDFCQALGISSNHKYQNEGGPSIEDCFKLLNSGIQPAVDRIALANIIVFNYMIGNMDAHGKNFSLIHHDGNRIQCAPFYDLVSTIVYPELTRKMAMKIASQYDPEKIFIRHWEALCQSVGYRFIAFKKILQNQAKLLPLMAQEEAKWIAMLYGKHDILDQIILIIKSNAKLVLNRMK